MKIFCFSVRGKAAFRNDTEWTNLLDLLIHLLYQFSIKTMDLFKSELSCFYKLNIYLNWEFVKTKTKTNVVMY